MSAEDASRMAALTVAEEKQPPTNNNAAVSALKRDIKGIMVKVDESLGKFLRASDTNRTSVVDAVKKQVEHVLTMFDEFVKSVKGDEILLTRSCQLLKSNKDNLIEAIEHLMEKEFQVEPDRNKERRNALEARRRALMGRPQEPMDGERFNTLQNSDISNDASNLQLTSQPAPQRPRRTPSTSSGQRGQFNDSDSERESCVSGVSGRSNKSGRGYDPMHEYMRAMAMPAVKVFNNKNGQKFSEFMRCFTLKYPEYAWSDEDRKEILAGFLEGEAKMHYLTLPKRIREGPFRGVISALKERLRVESQGAQAKALSELRTLQKREEQSVLNFCLELELLSEKAHPTADERTIALIQAEILYEQLKHWPEAYHLAEILESERSSKVFERMREAAVRIERIRDSRRAKGKETPQPSQPSHQQQKLWRKQREARIQNSFGSQSPSNTASIFTNAKPVRDTTSRGETRQNPKEVPDRCEVCNKRGHNTKDCWKSKPRETTSFSATLQSWSCSLVAAKDKSCQLVGPRQMVKIKCLDGEVDAMVDTGSQLTIMPLNVLLNAQAKGVDMDACCTAVSSEDIDVYDASGNKMDFLGCMQMDMSLPGRRPVRIKMHVKRLRDNIVLLGTNALECLGIRILIPKAMDAEDGPVGNEVTRGNSGEVKPEAIDDKIVATPTKVQQTVAAEEGQEPIVHVQRRERVSRKTQKQPRKENKRKCNRLTKPGYVAKAAIVQRVYVRPGGSATLQLRGGKQSSNAVLWPNNDKIAPGVCSISEKGLTEIPIINNSPEPLIFRKGEEVGEWAEKMWIDSKRWDPTSDMLELAKQAPPTKDRLEKLLNTLKTNNKAGTLSEELQKLLEEFHDIFAVTDQELTQTDLVEHDIDTGSCKPIKQKVRPIPQGLRKQLKEMLEDLEKRSIIRKSSSDWASPIVLVQKKDKTIRLCVDYRALNKETRQDAYPLPTIDTVLQSLGGKKYFSTLDMASGYWQVKLSKDAQRKSAFITPEGLYEFLVLPFGLCTSPAVFQRLMDAVLKDLLGEEVFVYIDDILIATDTEERHMELLRKVFQAFRKTNLRLKPQKCLLAEKSVAYLGHILDQNGVNMDPDKVSKIVSYPRPTALNELRTFLGMCGYYRKFVLNFAKIAKPMYELTSSKAPFIWNNDATEAFERLKEAIVRAPILGQPDVEGARTGQKPFIIYTDASNLGVGAVLCQEGADKMLHPLYFASKKLSSAEKRYHITDLEALAIVFALKKFHFFVFGVKTIVRTDHQPLTTLFKRNNVSPRVIRWALEVQTYDLTIEYVKGEANKVADALSRGFVANSDQDQVRIDGAEDIKVVNTVATESAWLQELRNDADYGPIITKIEEGKEDVEVRLPREPRKFRIADFCIHDGDLRLFLEDGSMTKVVPKSKRRELFDEAHAGSLAGHFNARKLTRQLKRIVYWEGMQQDISKWCKECKNCFLANNKTRKIPPLKPFTVTKPFEVIGVDVLEMGRTRNGNRYLVVVVDHFSKWLEAYPVETKSAENIAKGIFKRWICEGGRWPRTIHSDRGKEFENSVMNALCEVAGIHQSFTKGYNPRENGLTERANQTLIKMLKKKEGITTEWDELVPHVLYAYNITPHEATNESPFFILFGFDPVYPSNVIPQDEVSPYCIDVDDYRRELMTGMKTTYDIVRENNERYRQNMKAQYDRVNRVGNTSLPEVGDRVFMRLPAEKSKSRFPKLSSDWSGPYRVLESTETSALITDINGNSEPIKVQHDILVKIPPTIDNKPLVTKTKRKGRAKVACVSVEANYSYSNFSHFRPYPRQLVLGADKAHPLHVLFSCYEKALARPPREQPRKVGFPCQLEQNPEARLLRNVVRDLPHAVGKIRFDNVYHLAQLIAITLEGNVPEKELLFRCAKRAAVVTMDTLSIALLYWKEQCLHFQLSYEGLAPKDVYHEEFTLNRETIMISQMYQEALAKIQRSQWEGPIARVTKRTYLMLPQCMVKTLEYVIKGVTLLPYEIERLPKIERMADVLLMVSPREAEHDKLTMYLTPWIEKRSQEGTEIAVGICPIRSGTSEAREQARNLMNTLVNMARTTPTPKGIHIYPDAEPGEWDYPTRALGYDPYDENGKIGYNAIRKWISSVRKYWRSDWTEPMDKKTLEATTSRKRRSDDPQQQEPGPSYQHHWKRHYRPQPYQMGYNYYH
ncbi:hypothetical protein Aduo_016651 [Ancylostoma duodenale]